MPRWLQCKHRQLSAEAYRDRQTKDRHSEAPESVRLSLALGQGGKSDQTPEIKACTFHVREDLMHRSEYLATLVSGASEIETEPGALEGAKCDLAGFPNGIDIFSFDCPGC